MGGTRRFRYPTPRRVFSVILRFFITDVVQMVRFSAEQSVRYLSEYFAKQGWIRADPVKKARIAY